MLGDPLGRWEQERLPGGGQLGCGRWRRGLAGQGGPGCSGGDPFVRRAAPEGPPHGTLRLCDVSVEGRSRRMAVQRLPPAQAPSSAAGGELQAWW